MSPETHAARQALRDARRRIERAKLEQAIAEFEMACAARVLREHLYPVSPYHHLPALLRPQI